jgi:hypothetical protein
MRESTTTARCRPLSVADGEQAPRYRLNLSFNMQNLFNRPTVT